MDDEDDDVSPLEQEQIENEVAALEAQLNDTFASLPLLMERTGIDRDKEAADKRVAAMEWENREDFRTRAKLKAVAPLVFGAIPKVGSAISQSVTTLRGVNTENVMSALKSLQSLSAEARKDVEYVLHNKRKKAGKAAVSLVASGIDLVTPSPVPVAALSVTGVTVLRTVGKALAGTRGVKRREVATRILDAIQKDPIDRSYLSVVYALFINKPDPGVWVKNLYACSNRDLAVKVLMSKIASR